MRLFNTLTRQKQEFIPIEPGKVRMYSCGPTVYNYFHIGNARPFIVFDLLRRYFEYKGYEVTFVQNFTDIDDKVINRAHEEGVSYSETAERYINEYFVDARGLRIREATIHPRATENIDAIIETVSALIEKGYAYAKNGDVYYRTRKFADYGKLSHQSVDELSLGARIDINEEKEDPLDFALWKAAKPGEPFWESPWGNGRPGWHIECSAMANRYLGKTIDIHSGGVDLCFPHHENEIAQSEAANGQPFANYWLHNAFLNIDNRKMSKSEGNFFMVREAAEKYGYDSIRYFMLSAHYRSPLNYTADALLQARAALLRIETAVRNLKFAIEKADVRESSPEERESLSALDAYREKFELALDDDLNTADALSYIFEMIRKINAEVIGKDISRPFAEECYARLDALLRVLALEPEEAESIDAEIEALIEARGTARKNKDFATADKIRDDLKARGITLEDTPQGVKWHLG